MSDAKARKGMRGHDEHGNVRPADGRFGLHEPSEESDYVKSPAESGEAPARSRRGSNRRRNRGDA